MKWANKGHEFDALGGRIADVRAIYLFGAGIGGLSIHSQFSDRIEIKGFIDNDPVKQRDGVDGIGVSAAADIRLAENEAIVVCVQSGFAGEIMAQCRALGYVDGYTLFAMDVFFPLLEMYVHERLCLPSLSFLPVTACNLNCRDCLNFSPYMKHAEFRPLGRLKEDLSLLFSRIDSILLFHISGGEPFLYPALPDLIAFVSTAFRGRIGRLEMTTNGTIVPSDALCLALRDGGVNLIVDDYRDSVPEYADAYDAALEKYEAFSVSYRVQKVANWISLAPFETDHSAWSEEQLRSHFDACAVPWQEYRDGKLWLCNYAAYAEVAGIAKTRPTDYLDFTDGEIDRKALLEFRLGYSDRGYVEFCKRCRGYGNNTIPTKVAEQLPAKGNSWRGSGNA